MGITKQEILNQSQVIDIEDLMKIFGCGECKAQGIMRGIKSVRDSLQLKGKVSIGDYLAWYWRDVNVKPQEELAERVKKIKAKQILGVELSEDEKAIQALYELKD